MLSFEAFRLEIEILTLVLELVLHLMHWVLFRCVQIVCYDSAVFNVWADPVQFQIFRIVLLRIVEHDRIRCCFFERVLIFSCVWDADFPRILLIRSVKGVIVSPVERLCVVAA